LGALTRYTAVDYGPSIRCNELILGAIRKDSPMYDLMDNDPEIAARMERIMHVGRLGLPSDVANACMFLSSEESAFITGTRLLLDGGAHITSPFPEFSRIRQVLLEDQT
jgi:3-oxoacyl-[acyl-carrier protein] reductase